jgi:hypothetical protein
MPLGLESGALRYSSLLDRHRFGLAQILRFYFSNVEFRQALGDILYAALQYCKSYKSNEHILHAKVKISEQFCKNCKSREMNDSNITFQFHKTRTDEKVVTSRRLQPYNTLQPVLCSKVYEVVA